MQEFDYRTFPRSWSKMAGMITIYPTRDKSQQNFLPRCQQLSLCLSRSSQVDPATFGEDSVYHKRFEARRATSAGIEPAGWARKSYTCSSSLLQQPDRMGQKVLGQQLEMEKEQGVSAEILRRRRTISQAFQRGMTAPSLNQALTEVWVAERGTIKLFAQHAKCLVILLVISPFQAPSDILMQNMAVSTTLFQDTSLRQVYPCIQDTEVALTLYSGSTSLFKNFFTDKHYTSRKMDTTAKQCTINCNSPERRRVFPLGHFDLISNPAMWLAPSVHRFCSQRASGLGRKREYPQVELWGSGWVWRLPMIKLNSIVFE